MSYDILNYWIILQIFWNAGEYKAWLDWEN